jgi:rhodanese-related sulfurtransferase
MNELKTISPERAAALLRDGAAIVDVREADEYAREHIPGARNLPLSRIGAGAAGKPGETIVFHCRSGNRTAANAAKLWTASGPCEAYVLEGGLEQWKTARLPVTKDRGQPIEIMRQVQIAAGSMALLGVVLGFAVHAGFFLLSGAVGAGLIGAGISGTCLMAKLLAAMPWNRRAQSAA